MEMPTTLSSKSDQIQALGNILHLVEQLDIEDIATVTSGSRLGRVVDLLAQVKQTLSLDSGLGDSGRGNSIATTDRRKNVTNGANGSPNSITKQAGQVADKSGTDMAIATSFESDFESGKSNQVNNVNNSIPSKASRNGVATSTRSTRNRKTKTDHSDHNLSLQSKQPKSTKRKSSKAAAKSSKKASQVSRKRSPKSTKTSRSPAPKRIMISYLKHVFADPEVFPDRQSIADFFEQHFQIEFQVDKESRPELVSRLSRLAIAKKVSRNKLGDILLEDTNSKYGDFLKQDEATFLQGWQSGSL